MAKTEIWPRAKTKLEGPKNCMRCGVPIVLGQKYHFVQPRRGRRQYIHESCYEKELKK